MSAFGRLEPWSILDAVQFRRAQLHTGSIFGSDWFLVICLFKGGRLLIEFSTSKEASLSSSSQPLPAPITSLLGWLPLFVSPTQTLGSSGFSGEWGAPSPIIPSKPALITENDKTVWKLRELSGNGNRYAKEFLALFCGGFMFFLEMNEILCVGGSVWKLYCLMILKYIWRLYLKGVTSMKNPFGNIFLSLFRTFPPLGEAVFDLCLCLKLSQLWPLVRKVYVLWRDGLKTKIHELHKPTSQWLKAISFVLTSQKVGHFQIQINLEKKYQLSPQIRG